MANQRNCGVTKCLFCDKRRDTSREKPERKKSDCKVEGGEKQSKIAFWVCEDCGVPEGQRGVAAIMLRQQNGRDARGKEAAVIEVVAMDGPIRGADAEQTTTESSADSCWCQACDERRQFEQDQLHEVQNLQKYWLQLRHSVRQMYRDRLLRDGMTSKGKKFDLVRLSELVEKICGRDPHQLYQRLESIGREHVMELKVHLLQILVSPEKAGVSGESASESIALNMSYEIAEHFMRSLLNFASQFFETVNNMKTFLGALENEHLEKFDIDWRIVNFNLFDSVVYHDALLQATLPSVYSCLGFKVTLNEGSGEDDVAVIVDRKSIPSHITDIMKNFVDLGSTLAECRNRMEQAQERMEEYLSKQMKIYKATLKAKQKVLKQDLEFFKQQRRLLEEYVIKKKELKRSNSGEEDVSAFAETLRCLFSDNVDGKDCEISATTVECVRCHRSHCSCDQCSISHLIACGLSAVCADADLAESVQFFEGYSDSSDSSLSDLEEDSDYGGEVKCVRQMSPQDSTNSTNGKRTSIVGKEENQSSVKTQAALVAKNSCSIETMDDVSSADSVRRHMYNAYGDWEVNVDPATLLFSNRWKELLFPACTHTKGKHVTEEEYQSKAEVVVKLEEAVGNGKCSGEKGGTRRKLTEVEDAICMEGVRIVVEKQVPADRMTLNKAWSRKLPPCNVRSITPERKRSVTSPTANLALIKSKTESHCDVRERRRANQTSPRKSPIGTPSRVSQTTVLPQQFSQEWFKDPKNAKYAKALLACAVAGNNVDMACLKELNLDAETVKKLYSQYVEAADRAVTPDSHGTACCMNMGDSQKNKCDAGTKTHQGEPVSADEDDDSWSDHSSVMSQKENKHCDCCYCEMFGHGGADYQKSCGRYEYPQIRERLRLKLKKKESDHQSQKSENVDGYRGYESLDALVEYINGGGGGGKTADSLGAASKTNSKKTKKAQSKAKKSDKRKLEKHEHASSMSPRSLAESANLVLNDEHHGHIPQSGTGQLENDHSNMLLPSEFENNYDGGDSKDRRRMESQIAKQYALSAKKMSRKRISEEDDVNIDEVFRPKDIDLNSSELDEAEREVESFKRFVMDCQPRQNRAKVNLNIGHLLRERKTSTAPAMV